MELVQQFEKGWRGEWRSMIGVYTTKKNCQTLRNYSYLFYNTCKWRCHLAKTSCNNYDSVPFTHLRSPFASSPLQPRAFFKGISNLLTIAHCRRSAEKAFQASIESIPSITFACIFSATAFIILSKTSDSMWVDGKVMSWYFSLKLVDWQSGSTTIKDMVRVTDRMNVPSCDKDDTVSKYF